MPTRDEMIKALSEQDQNFQPPSREEMIRQLSELDNAPEPEKPSALEAGIHGLGQGASFGYIPQLTALTQKYVTEPLAEKVYGVPQTKKSYVELRDEQIARQNALKSEHPYVYGASELAGGLATGIATGGAGNVGKAASLGGKVLQGAKAGVKAGAIYGAVANPGDVEGEIDPLQVEARAKNAAKGAAVGGLVGAAVPLATEGVKAGSKYVADKVSTVSKGAADKLASFANKAAKNATGATGKQSAEFADDAGTQLLERGHIKFGDTQEKISKRLQGALDQAYSEIDDSLAKLEADGVKVDANEIYGKIRQKITELKGDPSKADIVSHLEREADNIINATEAKGSTEFGIKEAEQIKRGYNRKAGNWMDPEKGQAGKELYQTFRGAVEGAAEKQSPEIAKNFEKAKETYGLLAPIQEAAERRALTQNQSPAGGFFDTVTGLGAGVMTGNPAVGVGAAVGRRAISPRIASSIAVTAHEASKALRKIPQLATLELENPDAFRGIVASISQASRGSLPAAKAADKENTPNKPQRLPAKGPDKWASDGINKIYEHDKAGVISSPIIEQLQSSQKGRDLLIRASDLKPGSKAMDRLIEQIKTFSKDKK